MQSAEILLLYSFFSFFSPSLNPWLYELTNIWLHLALNSLNQPLISHVTIIQWQKNHCNMHIILSIWYKINLQLLINSTISHYEPNKINFSLQRPKLEWKYLLWDSSLAAILSHNSRASTLYALGECLSFMTFERAGKSKRSNKQYVIEN